MANKLRVLILGYGEMGHAMEHLLADRHEIHVWSRSSTTVLIDEVTRAQVILFCLPVNAHFEVATTISAWLSESCLCLTIAKGLDEAGRTAPQVLAHVFSNKYRYGVMYGPMISEEIRLGRYAFSDVALSNSADFQIVRSLYEGSMLICRHVEDMFGSSWSVILKNVYAILFGISDELNLGDNMRGHLMVTALSELSSIVQSLGAQAQTPYGYAGLGDLLTTATSEDSHHHELGRLFARGQYSNMNGEGIHTLKMVSKHHLFDTHAYPLYSLINDILSNPAELNSQIEAYLARIRRW